MRYRTLALVVASGLLLAADKAEDANKKALEQLEGTWKLESLTRDGKKAEAAEVENTELVVSGDTFTIKEKGRDMPAKVKLDASKKPAELDITPDKSTGAMKGIYKLEGDTFTMCFARDGKERPTEFASKADSGVVLATFKKAKK